MSPAFSFPVLVARGHHRALHRGAERKVRSSYTPPYSTCKLACKWLARVSSPKAKFSHLIAARGEVSGNRTAFYVVQLISPRKARYRIRGNHPIDKMMYKNHESGVFAVVARGRTSSATNSSFSRRWPLFVNPFFLYFIQCILGMRGEILLGTPG